VTYRRFITLGIKTDGNQVLTLAGRTLGQMAGAHAEMGESTCHHRVAGPLVATAVTAPVLEPLALLGMASKKNKSAAFVTFADGVVHRKPSTAVPRSAAASARSSSSTPQPRQQLPLSGPGKRPPLRSEGWGQMRKNERTGPPGVGALASRGRRSLGW
jgi:hypothetical protein